MVRSSFSILFFIRENRVRKDGTTIIEVLITVNGERRSINLELKMTFVKINDEWFIKKGDASLFQI